MEAKMKRRLFLLMLASLVMLVSAPSYGANEITLDTVTNLISGNTVQAGVPTTFTFRLTNTSGDNIIGSQNGFQVWMKQGGSRTSLTYDTLTVSPTWANMYDGGFYFNPSSNDGLGYDTIGFGGFAVVNPGIPNGFDTTVWWLQTTVDTSAVDDTLCVDSSWYPPAMDWIWTMKISGAIIPGWDGPHCFVVGLPCLLPNRSFEEGTLGQIPLHWQEVWGTYGPLSSWTHETWTVNTHYFDGSRSTYLHSRVVDNGVGTSYGCSTTVQTNDWINCPTADSVRFYIRGIASTHSDYWGWSNLIRVSFEDGQRSASVSVYSHGEFVNYNNYDSIVTGADGSNWYMYVEKISPCIDKTHMKVGITNIASGWSWYNWYSDLKCYVDLVELIEVPPCCVGIRGDVDGSGSINVSDVTYLTAYLKQKPPGSPAPPCFEEGDVDGSCTINVADATYLTAYLKQKPPGSPPPPACP
jgi:hypothetical protein